MFTLARWRLITRELVLLSPDPSAWLTGINLFSSLLRNLSPSFSSLLFLCVGQGTGLLIIWSNWSRLTFSISVFKFCTTATTGGRRCEPEIIFPLQTSFSSTTLSLLERKVFSFSESCQNPTPLPKLGPSSLCQRDVGSDRVLSPMKSFLRLICSILFHLPARAIGGHADRSPLLFDLLNNCSRLLCLQGFLKWLFRSNGDRDCIWLFEFVSTFNSSAAGCVGTGSCTVSLSHTTSLARSWSVTWRSCGVAASLERLEAASKWCAFIWIVDLKTMF